MTVVTAIEITCTVLAFGLGLGYACSAPRSQLLGPTVCRGPVRGGRVVLTFDDGPSSPFTDQILDILRDYKVPATFFVCGRNVERQPETLSRIHAEGHSIGNHTYSHPLLYFRSRRRISEEIDRTQALVEDVIGARPGIFRPPYGIRWFGLFPLLRQRGMRLVQWSDTGFDWVEKNQPLEIARRTLANLRSGAVILLHDGREALPAHQVNRSRTVAALPLIIEGARKAGLKFVSVEEFVS